jgi:hypothetical protein
MAISILYNPVPTRIFEADGDFAAGAKAYFYLSRTTTPLTVYTDAPMLTAHTWPVVADAYGLLAPIYIAKGTEYKVRIEDALGSILYAADGISNPADVTVEGGGEVGVVVTADEIFQTGDVMWNPASGPRAGWVRCNGRTISKASGTGTESNNDDCHDLFVFFWNNFPDSICPVTPGGRGGNAQADWDIAKSIATLDMRGRSAVGLDDMANTAANLIQVTTAIGTTSANPVVTAASSAGLAAGMFVIAAGIPAGTKIVGVTVAPSLAGDVEITLSANATATASDVPARFSIFSDAQTPGAGGGENTHTLLTTEGGQAQTYVPYTDHAWADVPPWATGCHVTFVIVPSGTGALSMQVLAASGVPIAGAAPYTHFGPSHYTGSLGYQTTAQTATGALPIALAANNASISFLGSIDIQLTRASAAANFAVKWYSTNHDLAAAHGGQVSWQHGFVGADGTGELHIAGLSFFGVTGLPGSFVHIQWFGDDTGPAALALARTPRLAGPMAEEDSLPAVTAPSEMTASPRSGEDDIPPSQAMNLHTPARLGSWYSKK